MFYFCIFRSGFPHCYICHIIRGISHSSCSPHTRRVRYGIVRFNVPLDTLQVISDTILRAKWPNQQCNSTEGQWLVNHMKSQFLQLHVQLIKKYKRRNQKMYYAYTTRKIEDTEALRWQRAKPSRSKPNIVNWPVRTARTFVQHYNSTQYCSTETVFLIFPFLQTNITSQTWPSGGKGITHTCTFETLKWRQGPVSGYRSPQYHTVSSPDASSSKISWIFVHTFVSKPVYSQKPTNKQTNKQTEEKT